jgi:fatty-acyl-CoA synthase
MSAHYTLSAVVERHASAPQTANLPAFTMGEQTRTFAELRANANRLADALLRLGIASGDRVAVLMGNRLEWLESLFAITSIGGICLPINVLLTGTDINALLQTATPKALIADAHATAALARMTAPPPHLIAVDELNAPSGVRSHPYADLLASGAPEDPPCTVSRAQPAMIYYTSGTTGSPKAVVHTHERVLWNTLHQVSDLSLTTREKYLVVPSFSWSAGLHHITLAQMWAGGCSEVLPTGPQTLERVVDTVVRAGVSRTFLAPTLLKQLLGSAPLLERLRSSTLSRVMTGAEPLPVSVTEALHRALPSCSITQAYGMTEMPLIATYITPDEARDHPASAGTASSITTIAVRRADDTIAFVGDGEIVLRSPATTDGYGGDARSEAAFRDGWFHTGDAGYLDESGRLTVTGRTKDMIITGGINLYPREIEEIIQQLPGVAEAAVIGVPDERWGERPVAIVVARTPHALSAQDVLEHCAAALSPYKRPDQVLIRTEPLPKTVTGKILKRELRAGFAR